MKIKVNVEYVVNNNDIVITNICTPDSLVDISIYKDEIKEILKKRNNVVGKKYEIYEELDLKGKEKILLE